VPGTAITPRHQTGAGGHATAVGHRRRSLDPSLYGHAAGSADEDVDDGGETSAAAVRRAQAESTRVRGRGNRQPLPMLMRVLLDVVIVPRHGDERAPAGDTEHFGREIHDARQLHKEWARAQLNGLPDDERAISEWIKLT
jgi:hypothetical protein